MFLVVLGKLGPPFPLIRSDLPATRWDFRVIIHLSLISAISHLKEHSGLIMMLLESRLSHLFVFEFVGGLLSPATLGSPGHQLLVGF